MYNSGHEETTSVAEIREELETSRQILKAIFDSTKSSIFLIDSDYQILFFNKWARDGCRLLYGREMYIGDSMLNYQNKENEKITRDFIQDFQQAILTKGLVVRECEMNHPQLSYWVRMEYTPVYDYDTLIGVLINATDISDWKEVEMENELQHKQLVKIAWSQSHETRQPVATLLGLINILDKNTLSSDNQEIIKLLESTLEKLDTIIHRTVVLANQIGTKSTPSK